MELFFSFFEFTTICVLHRFVISFVNHETTDLVWFSLVESKKLNCFIH